MVRTRSTLLPAVVVLASLPTVLVVMDGLGLLFPSDGQGESSSRILGEHRYPVHCIAFTSDGKTLAAGGGLQDLAGEVRLWDVVTGAECTRLEERCKVCSLMFSPDGHNLATASLGRIVKLWDVPAGRERQCIDLLDLPMTLVPSVAFSPDGRTLAVGGWARGTCVKLRCLATGAERTLTNGSGPWRSARMACA